MLRKNHKNKDMSQSQSASLTSPAVRVMLLIIMVRNSAVILSIVSSPPHLSNDQTGMPAADELPVKLKAIQSFFYINPPPPPQGGKSIYSANTQNSIFLFITFLLKNYKVSVYIPFLYIRPSYKGESYG